MFEKQVPSWVMLFVDPHYSNRHLTLLYGENVPNLKKKEADDDKKGFNDKVSSVMYCIGVGVKCRLWADPERRGNYLDLKGTGRLEKKDLKGEKIHDKTSCVEWMIDA